MIYKLYYILDYSKVQAFLCLCFYPNYFIFHKNKDVLK